jgi:hypothetical protein
MDDVMNEADFWFVVTGNVFLHTYLERDVKHGATSVPIEQCTGWCRCISRTRSRRRVSGVRAAGRPGGAFAPALDEETGEPKIEKRCRDRRV